MKQTRPLHLIIVVVVVICEGKVFPLQAQRVGRGIALLIHDTVLEGGEWSAAHPGRTLPPGKDPVPIVQETEWAPGPVLTNGKSRPTGI